MCRSLRQQVVCGVVENVQSAVSTAAANLGKAAVVAGSSLLLASVRAVLASWVAMPLLHLATLRC
jgi:hypothetical protein